MFCTTSDNRQLYFEEFGNRSGSTVIFLNGLTQSTVAWSFMTGYFKEIFHVVLLDFIFQGKSDKTGEWRNFDQHAADVKTLLDHLSVKSACVVGISYGSLVAQHIAVLYPAYVRSLVLVSTFAHKTPYYQAIESSWWKSLEKGGYSLLLEIMLPTVLSEEYFANPLIPIEVMKEMRKGVNENSEAIFKLMKATRERGDYRPQLKQIKCPTLIIQGERDALLPVHMAEEVQKAIPGAKLIVIKHAGHTLNLEHVPEVGQLILDHIKK